MTVSEARTIIFVGEAIVALCKSLRDDQVTMLSDILDVPQQAAFLEIVGVVSRPEAHTVDERRRAWASLVEAAKQRIAIAEDPLRPMVDPCLSGCHPRSANE